MDTDLSEGIDGVLMELILPISTSLRLASIVPHCAIAFGTPGLRDSRDDLVKDRAGDIGQTKIAAVVRIGQFCMVQAQQMQDRGM